MSSKIFVSAATLAGLLGSGLAQAHSNLQWSVTIGAPLPVLVAPQPVWTPPVVVAPRYYHQHHRQAHWDADGDGIPNRHDRVYNPRWDRDGDGIPNRYDRHSPRPRDRDGDGVRNRYDRHPHGWGDGR